MKQGKPYDAKVGDELLTMFKEWNSAYRVTVYTIMKYLNIYLYIDNC